ncbi:unnamed protein product [Rhizoctonia solani]|uniref:Ricin B lectin domain-containing protein n=1 Tax=Rhizoctonia solani TaxID=456999 RepID=A0A8H3DFB0_9AGAM|nr:unnamed protein product [Rhizoctonia solani]
MGQASSTWDTYEPDGDVAPGTYRIVHNTTNKVLRIHEENNKMLLVTRDRQDQGSDDHWFIMRSGDAFMFKHCQSENYIGGLPANNRPVCATRYPTTWAIRVKKSGDGLKGGYIGIGANSSGVRLCSVPLSEREEADHLWRLEHVGSTTFDQDRTRQLREVQRQLQLANDQCIWNELELKTVQRQLVTKTAELESVQNKLNKQAIELQAVQDESRKQTAELKEQHKVLDAIKTLLNPRRAIPEDEGAKSDNNKIVVCEKAQDVSPGQDTLRNIEAEKNETVENGTAKDGSAEDEGASERIEGRVESQAEHASYESGSDEDESAVDKQVSGPTTQEPQRKDIGSTSPPNVTTQQPAPAPGIGPAIQPLSASVEQQLASMGFLHFD